MHIYISNKPKERREGMEKYETPEMEVIEFKAEDIITDSLGENDTPIG